MERLDEEMNISQDYDIEELSNLMKRLEILSEEKEKKKENNFKIEEESIEIENSEEESEENEDIIIGYDTNEEEYNLGEDNKGTGTSGTKNDFETKFKKESEDFETFRRKRKHDEYWNPTYQYKTTKMEREYQPKKLGMDARRSLNIDCIINRDDMIREWSNELAMELMKWEAVTIDEILRLAEYKTSGILRTFIEKIDPSEIKGIGPGEKLKHIVKLVSVEFLGKDIIDHKKEVIKLEIDIAKRHLSNMCIGNMCYIDKFICEYEKYYYQLEKIDQETYKELFINKLPPPIGEELRKNWMNRPLEISPTFGGLIWTLKDLIREICTKNVISHKLKMVDKICCDKNDPEIPGQYGCGKPYKEKRYKKKKYVFKKQRNPKKKYRQKYFREKIPKKYCPKGKKTCRCWICNEEGHYANKCPKKKDKPEKIKIIKIAEEQNLEPFEWDISSDDQIYEYMTDYSEECSDESS